MTTSKRPILTQALANAVCDRLAAGDSLRAIARQPGFPSASTLYGWAANDAEIAPDKSEEGKAPEEWTSIDRAIVEARTLRGEASNKPEVERAHCEVRFHDHYARAREVGFHQMVDEILEISDDASADQYEDQDGNVRTDHEAINRSRLKVDTRKWLLSKVLPKLYGDKPGAGGDRPVRLVLTGNDADL